MQNRQIQHKCQFHKLQPGNRMLKKGKRAFLRDEGLLLTNFTELGCRIRNTDLPDIWIFTCAGF